MNDDEAPARPDRTALSRRLSELRDDEVGADERAAGDLPHAEQIESRSIAPAELDPGTDGSTTARSTFHFPDGGPIRLVCGAAAAESTGAYADPANPNYTRLHGYADPDALVELFGHIRMVNPDSDVRFLLGDEMGPDDLTAHVVLLGGLRLNPAARFFAHAGRLPVRQVDDDDVENGEVFEIDRDGRPHRFLPTFLEGDPSLGLIEDVCLLARMPNPNLRDRTLTWCNGVFSRGVLGSVRALTDAQLRDRNEEYVRTRFGGDREFGLLLRVPVFGGEASTPDLANDHHRLYAWTA
jgi:hypothetical protein